MVGEGGFEPPKASPTDLQSAPFGHSGIPPYLIVYLILTRGANQRSVCGAKRKKEGADGKLSAPREAERSELLLTLELVDGLEPPTC